MYQTKGGLHRHLRVLVPAILLALPAVCRADTREEFWPEFNLIYDLTSRYRLRGFVAPIWDPEANDFSQGWFGLDIDDRGNRRVFYRLGYHYLETRPPGGGNRSEEHRLQGDITPRWFFRNNLLLQDRNRLELRLIDGDGSWRYRNRLRVSTDLFVGGSQGGGIFDARSGGRRVTPYFSIEPWYDSRRHTVTRWRYELGAETPLDRRWLLDLYLTRQHDIGPNATSHVNALGTNLTYFLN